MAELKRLLTDLGERSTYDAASQCSRCGYCEQACPTYKVTGRESRSPRGRNQVVRMMLEGKLTDPASAAEALSTCLLCGACSSACYAHVPTADIVLEGRRMIRGKAGWGAKAALKVVRDYPGLMKAAFFLKKTGVSRLARASGLTKLLGLDALAKADEHLDRVPGFILADRLESLKAEKPGWLYFAACGSNFLFPESGLKTVEALQALLGPGAFLGPACCGLLAYNYGDLEDARAMARGLIEKAGKSEVPIVADCSSCVAHLKTYPQLFINDSEWTERSKEFSSRVKDSLEVFAENAHSLRPLAEPEAATYHDSCRARHGQGLSKEPRAVMTRLFGGSFFELPDPEACCGGAGAFAFENPELSDEVLRKKISAIASVQARVVATSSTSCLAQLSHGLKKYYPECRVVPISELVAESLQLS